MAKPSQIQNRSGNKTHSRQLNIYERSKQQRAERERRLSLIRKQVMEECTFAPKMVSSPHSDSPTTKESSSGESVFDRLYHSKISPRSAGSTPSQSNSRRQVHADYSPLGNINAASQRVNRLYAQGVKKLRSRPMNERDEKNLRDRRLEDKELAECSFRPRRGAQVNSRKSTLVMKPQTVRQAAVRRRSLTQNTPIVPHEIVVNLGQRLYQKPWHTPLRKERKATDGLDFMLVSPLRNPKFLAAPSDEGGEDNDNGDVSKTLTHDDQTEYGSI